MALNCCMCDKRIWIMDEYVVDSNSTRPTPDVAHIDCFKANPDDKRAFVPAEEIVRDLPFNLDYTRYDMVENPTELEKTQKQILELLMTLGLRYGYLFRATSHYIQLDSAFRNITDNGFCDSACQIAISELYKRVISSPPIGS